MPKRQQASTLFDALLGASRPGRARAPRASGGPAASRPPVLVGGANSQAANAVRSVKVDWLNYTGPDCLVHKLRQYLETTCGLGEPDEDKRHGLYNYGKGLWWGNIALCWSPDSKQRDTFGLYIPASGLDVIRETIPINQLCRWLQNGGCKPTRVDIAIDVVGDEGTVDLCANVLNSCERGELVGAKSVRPIVEFNPRTGEMAGCSINAGANGKNGSGRTLCCYDKGLERKTHPPCTWQRYEVRFWRDHAPLLAEDLAADLPEHYLAHHAYGAYDYLDHPEKRKRDRERVKWWAEFVKGERITTARPKRAKPTLAGVAKWIDRSVVPAIRTYAVAANISLEEFFAKVVGTATPEPSRNATYSQAFREWCAHAGVSRRVALDRIAQARENAGSDHVVPLLLELLGIADREAVPCGSG